MKNTFLILIAALILTGCGSSSVSVSNNAPIINPPTEVKETGKTIDLTELNGQTVTTTPGDIIYVKLTGSSEGNRQWYVISPTTTEFLKISKHESSRPNDKALEKFFTDEWSLKIIKAGTIPLQFDYGKVGQKAEKSFQVTIISQ